MRRNRRLQHLLDCAAEALPVQPSQLSYLPIGMDSRLEEGLTRIDISNAYDDRCVHQEVFHRLPESASPLLQIYTGKTRRQRFRSQMPEPRMLRQFLSSSVEAHAEAPRIVKPQFKVWSQVEHQVIMRRIQGNRLPQPQSSSHAEMEYQNPFWT